MAEGRLQLGRTAFPLDEIADQASFIHIEHHQVPSVGILHHLAGGSLRFLVVVLSVDDGSEPIPGVTLDPLPDVQHRSAGGIDQHAPDGTQSFEISDCHAEGGHDDDIIRIDGREVEVSVLAMSQERNAHVTQLLVHVGVVDDLTHQEEPTSRKLGPGLVGILHRAVNAVAEAELASQSKRQPTHSQAVIVRAQRLDDTAVIVSGEAAGDLALEPKAFAEVGVLHELNLYLHRRRQRSYRQNRREFRAGIPYSAERS